MNGSPKPHADGPMVDPANASPPVARTPEALAVETTERAVARLPRVRAAWILRGVLLVLFLSAPVIAMRVPIVQQFVVSLAHGLRDGGARGIAIYWVVCALCGGIAAPMIVFAGIAGFAFGPVGGVAVALPGIALHACSAFLLGRTFLRARVEEKLTGNARWAGIEGALRTEGFRIAVLLRLTPILPQNLLSFALSASSISFARFTLATVLGLAPIVVVQATLGSLVEDAAQLLSSGGDTTPDLIVLGVSAIASLLALYAVTRVASRALGRAMERHHHSDEQR